MLVEARTLERTIKRLYYPERHISREDFILYKDSSLTDKMSGIVNIFLRHYRNWGVRYFIFNFVTIFSYVIK